MKIMRRNNSDIWSLRGQVPVRFRDVERRKEVWISLGTDSISVARLTAQKKWDEQVTIWEARLRGESGDAEARFEAAREITKKFGISYSSAEKILSGNDIDILKRPLAAFPATGQKPVKFEADSILGTVAEPKITVSRALEIYWNLTRAKTLGRSPEQVRKWQNPIRQANRDFIEAIADKPIAEITRDDVRTFRDFWQERIETEDLNPSTANKNMDHFGKVLKLANEEKGLDLTLPLGGLRFEEGEKGRRPPFADDWIRNRLLKAGALDELHPEARAVVIVMVNTGARPSEICGLTASTIKLADNVPHISIEPEGQKLKTKHSRRKIPLTGVSLEIMRKFPDGFPTYRETARLSKEVNEYFTAHKLRETPEHTLYSLRHSFEDRMLKAGIDERIRRDLMGHRLTRERYGDGGGLDHVHGLLHAIAL